MKEAKIPAMEMKERNHKWWHFPWMVNWGPLDWGQCREGYNRYGIREYCNFCHRTKISYLSTHIDEIEKGMVRSGWLLPNDLCEWLEQLPKATWEGE